MLCWAAIAAVIGIFVGLAHLLNSALATVVVFQLILLSCLFGFLGSQIYKRKDERDGWRRADMEGRDEADEVEDASFAWRRGRKRKIAPV